MRTSTSDPRSLKNKSFRSVVAAATVALFSTTLGCSVMEEQPPATDYTQAEAYEPMEQGVADLVEALPDFPGFERRSWNELPCSHGGLDDSDYTSIEIRYTFSEAVSATTQVREDYLDELRTYWSELGLDIHRDDASGTGKYHSIEARREDGINFYYSVGYQVGLMIQSGCVPRSDVSELTYIPPSGGIVPGSEQDTVAHDSHYFPEGVPTDQAAAIDPFATAQPVSGPVPFDPPASYEGHL
ncbi:hypothetical protein LO763_12175 [Glycomyces sp. A-F 0318]|uniref:hypothetical protein n=1 Tax=Glycomyces amatae TaxID=2881355 RepID=UPI001E578777|nr:hypothetical protein [Glycomyces amatae]MCD0444380.1 hypothetical protein [Glycomyces amatae]